MVYRRLMTLPGFGVRNVFDEINRMQQYMGRLSDAVIHGGHRSLATPAGVFPAVNLTEDKDGYFVRAELPGVKADDLDIQVVGRSLAIAGQRKITAQGEGCCYHRREREGGKFSRVLSLPGDIDSDKVTAKLNNGILTVHVPKAETAKPKQISIN